MSVERTVGRLLSLYPARWRARYGEELADLVVATSAGPGVPMRQRVDLVRGAVREHRRAIERGLRSRDPGAGLRAVLWAWALFVAAGLVVQTDSEHWQAVAPGGGGPVASVAFATLNLTAIVGSAFVIVAIALALPSAVALLRAGGGPVVRTRCLRAVALSAVWVAATVGIAVWAQQLSGQQRATADWLETAGFAVWALLGLTTLLAWTAAAAAIQRRIVVRASILRAQTWLAVGVATAMGTMATATAVWWVAVGVRSPAALTGSQEMRASAAVPALIVAMVVMLASTATGTLGARRAVSRPPAPGPDPLRG